MRLKRLKGRDRIRALFAHGQTVHASPLLLRYQLNTNANGVYWGISVPKKKFKRAVDRNRIKRQLWALAYHHRQKLMALFPDREMVGMLVFLDTKHHSHQDMERFFLALLDQWEKSIED